MSSVHLTKEQQEKKNTIAYTISFFKFGTTDIFVLARVLRGVLSSQICF